MTLRLDHEYESDLLHEWSTPGGEEMKNSVLLSRLILECSFSF